jgi:phosphatidylinositol alpha-mannosyltransferase
MPFIHQQFPDARLVVVGRGNRDRFDGLMERYGVRNVDFFGMASPEELPHYYASCDLFCAPSIAGESFGIVLLEAMASGRPVVAGDIPGYRSVMTNGKEGLLAPPKDPHALALAIVRLLADAPLRNRLSAEGQVTAGQYAWPEIASRVLAIYERAMQTSAAARLSSAV